jgi:tetratricopeptide (TPR) repeat protein
MELFSVPKEGWTQMKVLGTGHPDTLTSVSNLALVLRDQGKYKEAEEMHRRALEGKEKVLGTEHPYTLISVNNLASVLQDQGKYEEAEEMNRRALEGREKVLGLEHPRTLEWTPLVCYHCQPQKLNAMESPGEGGRWERINSCRCLLRSSSLIHVPENSIILGSRL